MQYNITTINAMYKSPVTVTTVVTITIIINYHHRHKFLIIGGEDNLDTYWFTKVMGN